jgi:hypothetical protein
LLPKLDDPKDPKEKALTLFWFIVLFWPFFRFILFELELGLIKLKLLSPPLNAEVKFCGCDEKLNADDSVWGFAKVGDGLFELKLLWITPQLFKLGFDSNFRRFSFLSFSSLIDGQLFYDFFYSELSNPAAWAATTQSSIFLSYSRVSFFSIYSLLFYFVWLLSSISMLFSGNIFIWVLYL